MRISNFRIPLRRLGGTADAIGLNPVDLLMRVRVSQPAPVCKLGGIASIKNNHRKVAKAEASYMPAPAMVHLCKPAQRREASFTDKTGGGNDDADVVERTLADAPARERR
jgi:hypothetical protein